MASQDKRNSVLLWLVLIVLVVGITAIIYLGYRQFTQPSQAPAAATANAPAGTEPAHWAGKYYYAGMPRPAPSFPYAITVETNIGYVVGYCEEEEDPAWVCYRLIKVDSFQAPPRPQGFEPDMRTRARVTPHDYTGSGYDRGHMAPNYAIAICYGSQAQLETFLMSNIVPQRPNLNRRVWENLEQTEIKEYAQRYRQLWVIDGPVFKPGARRLRHGVEVPDACYKIMVEEERGRPKVLAFIMPEEVAGTESPAQFLSSVSEVEKETGLDFFSELPSDLQRKLEAETARAMW